MIGDDKLVAIEDVVMSVGVYRLQKYMQVMIASRGIEWGVLKNVASIFASIISRSFSWRFHD